MIPGIWTPSARIPGVSSVTPHQGEARLLLLGGGEAPRGASRVRVLKLGGGEAGRVRPMASSQRLQAACLASAPIGRLQHFSGVSAFPSRFAFPAFLVRVSRLQHARRAWHPRQAPGA